MVLPQDGILPKINNPRKIYAKCPMCQGKGYYEQLLNPLAFNEVTLHQENGNDFFLKGHLKHEKHARRNTISEKGEPLKLPVIVQQSRQNLPKIQITEDSVQLQSMNLKENEHFTHSAEDGRSSVFGNVVFPQIRRLRKSPISNGYLKSPLPEEIFLESRKDLLPEPKQLENPHEAMRIAISNLKQSQWQIVLQAVHDIVQVSRYNPAMVEPHMPVVYRTLCQLMQSLRSQVTRTACQAMRELFRTMQSSHRPEFDEVVFALLQRTADLNRFIRQDSNEALDSMVMYIPPYHSVRALVDKGAGHKNPLVRTATARLLTCIVMISGSETILSSTANKDTRSQVLLTAAKLLGDGNLETRIFAKKLIRFLMENEDFDSIFYNVIDSDTIRKIEKTLSSLRSQLKKVPARPSRNVN